ncbi:Hypothetical predicted protein [Mytilus galloprovincialis]|uniref:B box-type domain-containing protein n=1 Tax=Mytilus galloprovincialis TaxID=29158 RepID=A0A8B6CZX2_MYTGA|nr:Hypothetical predicted protein [Mytilus galloprovincialis]
MADTYLAQVKKIVLCMKMQYAPMSRHISKAAEEYCPVCEEALCSDSDCKGHTKLSKASKNHQAISIDEYNKLPPFIREIIQECDVHGDRFEFFCPTHNELCCKRCITTTLSECKGSKVIEDFVEFSKSSTSIDECHVYIPLNKAKTKRFCSHGQIFASHWLRSSSLLCT